MTKAARLRVATTGAILLVAFVFALPFVHVWISSAPEETIAALDLCSFKAPGATADTATIAEPVFQSPDVLAVADTIEEKPAIYYSTVVSPGDKPPLA